jgi:hypothetical protein
VYAQTLCKQFAEKITVQLGDAQCWQSNIKRHGNELIINLVVTCYAASQQICLFVARGRGLGGQLQGSRSIVARHVQLNQLFNRLVSLGISSVKQFDPQTQLT